MDSEALPDGIYFDLHEDRYHALPRLSMSGIQSLMVSPATFWAGSWMNPAKEKTNGDTPARILGRAYHVARFEPERFHDLYCRDLGKEDMEEGTLMTDTEIKAALKDLEQPQTKAGETVLDRAARLIDLGYEGKIWHYERMLFEDELLGDRTAISGTYWDQILEDMARIHRNPEVAEHLKGGQAEVSVLWTDEASGVQMKCRFDYLKPDSFTDLKTFENSARKRVEQAIFDAFRYNRYYIQAFGYWQVTELLRSNALDIQGEATDAQIALIQEIMERTEPCAIWYIFQEKKGVPNLFAYQIEVMVPPTGYEAQTAGLSEEEEATARAGMSGRTALSMKADVEIRAAIDLYRTYKEVYPDDSEWFPLNPLGKINDESFSSYWLEEVQR